MCNVTDLFGFKETCLKVSREHVMWEYMVVDKNKEM